MRVETRAGHEKNCPGVPLRDLRYRSRHPPAGTSAPQKGSLDLLSLDRGQVRSGTTPLPPRLAWNGPLVPSHNRHGLFLVRQPGADQLFTDGASEALLVDVAFHPCSLSGSRVTRTARVPAQYFFMRSLTDRRSSAPIDFRPPGPIEPLSRYRSSLRIAVSMAESSSRNSRIILSVFIFPPK